MPQTQLILLLRMQAWERAKGELKAMMQASFEDIDWFEKASAMVDEFIKNFQNRCC
jgi:hypothetical protein